MTDDTAARLRALAQAAPKGPWTLLGAPDDAEPHLWTVVTADGLWTAREPVAEFYKLRPEARALQAAAGRYIAAASPDVLLRLLDERDALRRESKLIEHTIESWYDGSLTASAAMAAISARLDAILGGDKGAA